MSKILVVGAGITGATLARLYAEHGDSVIVIDKRDAISGNLFDKKNRQGVIVQQYGTHVFHSDSKKVYDFLSRFTCFTDYVHKVLAKTKKASIPVPVNFNSIRLLYKGEKAERIISLLSDYVGLGNEISIFDLKNHEDAELREFAELVYEKIYRKYSVKLWGKNPEILGDDVMSKVPVRVSDNDAYFKEKYQGLPVNGFTETVFNILTHPNIQLKLKTDAKKVLSLKDGKIFLNGVEFQGKVIYTGRVDELLDYKFGNLEYRTLKFKYKVKRCSSYQFTGKVNYTESKKRIVVTEWTKLYPTAKKISVISKEYATAYKGKGDVPLYPVPSKRNVELYYKYVGELEQYKNLYLLGRNATYKNISIDKAVLSAMEFFDKNKGE